MHTNQSPGGTAVPLLHLSALKVAFKVGPIDTKPGWNHLVPNRRLDSGHSRQLSVRSMCISMGEPRWRPVCDYCDHSGGSVSFDHLVHLADGPVSVDQLAVLAVHYFRTIYIRQL